MFFCSLKFVSDHQSHEKSSDPLNGLKLSFKHCTGKNLVLNIDSVYIFQPFHTLSLPAPSDYKSPTFIYKGPGLLNLLVCYNIYI